MNKIQNFRKKFCIKNNNKLMISEKGIKLISYPKHNSTSKFFHTKTGSSSSKITSKQKSEIINQLLKLNQRQEIEIKSLKEKNQKAITNHYHKKRLPTPGEWAEVKKDNQLQSKYIKILKKRFSNMNLIDKIKMLFK